MTLIYTIYIYIIDKVNVMNIFLFAKFILIISYLIMVKIYYLSN
jgi:hypothetical protein